MGDVVGLAVIRGRDAEVEVVGRCRKEVCLGLDATKGVGGVVLGEGGLLGSLECDQPNTCLLPRVSYFCGIASLWSLPNPFVAVVAIDGAVGDDGVGFDSAGGAVVVAFFGEKEEGYNMTLRLLYHHLTK